MPVVNPGIRRYIGSAIQRLFNSASFSAPLTHSLTLERGTGSPTYTRATTATFQDNEGILRTAIAGEARFPGARRVRNLLTYPEDFSNAAWVNASGNTITTNAVANPVNGAVTADKITPPASAAFHSVYQAYALSGATHAYSLYVKNAGYNFAYISPDNGSSGVTINLTTGATSITGSVTAYASDEGNGWWRVACISAVTTSNLRVYIGSTTAPQSFTGDGTSGIYVWGAQLEDITGRTDQTTPSEYVSVGVPGDWYGTDLVTNGTFDTDTTGWTAGNSAVLSVDTGRLKITTAGASNGYAWQGVPTVVGTKYVVSAVATVGAGCTSANFNVSATSAPNADLGSAITTSTTPVLLQAVFTATGTTTYITFVKSAEAGGIVYWDEISVKPAVYHGAGVDGVKYFDTDLSGNPIAASTLKGYLAEPAATNLTTYSNDYSGWGASGNNTTRSQVAGPNGSSTGAMRFTETTANAQHYDSWPAQIKAASAIQYTFSFLAKKGTRDYIIAVVGDSAGNFGQATFNLDSGTISAAASVTGTFTSPSAGILPFGNGWYLVWVTATSNTATTVRGYVCMSNDGTALASYTGATDKYVDVSDGQLETGSSPSSRILTTTLAVTRNADVLTYTGGNITNIKTLACSFQRAVGVSNQGVPVALDVGAASTKYALSYLDNASTFYFQGADTTLQWQQTASNAYTPGTQSKVAFSIATNSIKMDKDGVAQTTDTSASVPATTILSVGHYSAGQLVFNGNIGGIYGWTRNLSQSELGAVDR